MGIGVNTVDVNKFTVRLFIHLDKELSYSFTAIMNNFFDCDSNCEKKHNYDRAIGPELNFYQVLFNRLIRITFRSVSFSLLSCDESCPAFFMMNFNVRFRDSTSTVVALYSVHFWVSKHVCFAATLPRETLPANITGIWFFASMDGSDVAFEIVTIFGHVTTDISVWTFEFSIFSFLKFFFESFFLHLYIFLMFQKSDWRYWCSKINGEIIQLLNVGLRKQLIRQ